MAVIRPRDVLSHVEYAESGCWLYTGARTKEGYPLIRDPDHGHWVYVHRWAFKFYIGEIPAGFTIDHLCHTFDLACLGGKHDPHRRCFNPDDLEAVTRFENTQRKRRKARGLTEAPSPAAFVL